jgi:CRISPR-associated protein Cas5h
VFKLKVLCFRFFGDFGHFRPYYTTTSPVTYSLMPPTAIMGVIGTILGLEKDKYYKILQEAGTRIGVGIVSPVRKKNIGINLVNTKGDYWIPTSKNASGPRTPTRYELLVNPEYLIFVTMSNMELLEDLATRIKQHKPCYSVSMGLAWLLADFVPVMFGEATEITHSPDLLEFASAVPISCLDPESGIGIVEGVRYCKERFVKSFGDDRKPLDYVDAIFSVSSEKARFRTSTAYKLDNMIFQFLT